LHHDDFLPSTFGCDHRHRAVLIDGTVKQLREAKSECCDSECLHHITQASRNIPIPAQRGPWPNRKQPNFCMFREKCVYGWRWKSSSRPATTLTRPLGTEHDWVWENLLGVPRFAIEIRQLCLRRVRAEPPQPTALSSRPAVSNVSSFQPSFPQNNSNRYGRQRVPFRDPSGHPSCRAISSSNTTSPRQMLLQLDDALLATLKLARFRVRDGEQRRTMAQVP
jgi:hypothetical protein